MKLFITISFFLISRFIFSQIHDVEIKERMRISANEISSWNIDAFQNLIIAEKSTISKYTNEGKLIYQISNKSYGEIKQVIPITPLKIIVFSEQQQRICFLDNTLTQVDECIDLSDYNIGFATQISRSGRGDKLWVFDQINSKILLIDLNKPGKIIQEIRNTSGLIYLGEIKEFLEFQSKLYILDDKKQLTTFDIYGSLISQEELEADFMASTDEYLWFCSENKLLIQIENENIEYFYALPVDEIENLKSVSSQIYIQSKNQILIFDLVKKK